MPCTVHWILPPPPQLPLLHAPRPWLMVRHTVCFACVRAVGGVSVGDWTALQAPQPDGRGAAVGSPTQWGRPQQCDEKGRVMCPPDCFLFVVNGIPPPRC